MQEITATRWGMHPYPDSMYHGSIIIPHVVHISEKLRCNGNHFNVKTIFKTNTHSVGCWWKVDRLEMSSRRSNMCTVFHEHVADDTSAKQAQRYALWTTNTIWYKVCLKNKNRCNTHIKKTTGYLWKVLQTEPNMAYRKYRVTDENRTYFKWTISTCYFTEKNVLLQKTLRNLMPFEMHSISEI
jgi:hypothetical protein